MPENYPSASEITRNISQLPDPPEFVDEMGRFRIVRLVPPFWGGYEYWVINEKGFFWEPAISLERAREYLGGDEARAYNEGE